MAEKNLGDILIEQGIISDEALKRALHLQDRRLGEILIEEKLADPVAIANALLFQARSKGPRRSSRLTVEARVLDELLRRIETIEDQLSEITKRSPAAVGALPAYSSLISLRQTVEMLLLEPVEALFQKTRWIAGQAATEAGKKIALQIHGSGLLIDRSLIDDLADILLHLVRNAIDHGIESDEARSAARKVLPGTIEISLKSQGGRLVLTVKDDGAGIDEDKVFERAVAAGLLDPDRKVATREMLIKVLFTPGFSTHEKVSPLSGRGVGLDVVEATAIRLGGEVKVESTAGGGSTFTVAIPLHYTRINIVPLRIGSEWIAVNSSEIESIESVSDSTGLLSAASLFSAPAVSRAPQTRYVKIKAIDGSAWAFDEVGQPEDVLVRDASAFAKGFHGVIGGTRMREGRSVLLIELAALARICEKLKPL